MGVTFFELSHSGAFWLRVNRTEVCRCELQSASCRLLLRLGGLGVFCFCCVCSCRLVLQFMSVWGTSGDFLPVLLRLGGRQERVPAVAARPFFSRLMFSYWKPTFVRSRVRRELWCCWCKLSSSIERPAFIWAQIIYGSLPAFLCIPATLALKNTHFDISSGDALCRPFHERHFICVLQGPHVHGVERKN